jgi:hypothetical protein
MLTAPKLMMFFALALSILFGSLLINWSVFSAFKKIAEKRPGGCAENQHLMTVVPAIVGGIVNFLFWFLLFLIVF